MSVRYTVGMLDHHLQRTIVDTLAYRPAARFSELKPDSVDNKLFNYHLHKVIVEGYVYKTPDGLYSLTQEGRRLSTGVLDNAQELIVQRPLSALFLIVRRSEGGAWLLYRRKTHPMLGYAGFMHCHPDASLSVEAAAAKQLTERTGLEAKFSVLGGGYFRIFRDSSLESFTHFTLLFTDEAKGELVPGDQHADYFWVDNPLGATPPLFPGTQLLLQSYQTKQTLLVDERFDIETV